MYEKPNQEPESSVPIQRAQLYSATIPTDVSAQSSSGDNIAGGAFSPASNRSTAIIGEQAPLKRRNPLFQLVIIFVVLIIALFCEIPLLFILTLLTPGSFAHSVSVTSQIINLIILVITYVSFVIIGLKVFKVIR